MFHQIPLNTAVVSSKQKGKPYGPGVTASVEDVKYQQKYKELKKKVKEIESVRNSSSSGPPLVSGLHCMSC